MHYYALMYSVRICLEIKICYLPVEWNILYRWLSIPSQSAEEIPSNLGGGMELLFRWTKAVIIIHQTPNSHEAVSSLKTHASGGMVQGRRQESPKRLRILLDPQRSFRLGEYFSILSVI